MHISFTFLFFLFISSRNLQNDLGQYDVENGQKHVHNDLLMCSLSFQYDNAHKHYIL